MTSTGTCPIWGNSHPATYRIEPRTGMISVTNSERAGGSYKIPDTSAIGRMHDLTLSMKARLTTWLIDQRTQGNEAPEITREVLDDIEHRRPLEAHTRAERLLQFIGSRMEPVGSPYNIREIEDGAYAWSESTSVGEIGFLINYLLDRGWLDSTDGIPRVTMGAYYLPVVVRVTVDGYGHIGDRSTSVDSSQAFVAMWLDDSMKKAYDQGIAPAIEDAGYKPFLITRKEHINKIEDEVIAEIKRSKFLVADFSHGANGVRGSVYYEAGFARGRNIPVIFTCQKDSDLHFDTSHFNHIIWTTPDELRKRLRDCILHVIEKDS